MSAAPARHPRPIPQPARKAAPRRAGQPQRPQPLRSQPQRTQPQRGAQPQRSQPQRTQPQRTARPAPASGRHLRAVRAPEQSRSLVPFAWTCALIVIAALGAVLLLNTSMASGAYERRDLKVEIANLHEQRSAHITQLEQRSSPDQLGADARALGMQPATVFGFLSLADSLVIESGSK